jgi:hypothetical protein
MAKGCSFGARRPLLPVELLLADRARQAATEYVSRNESRRLLELPSKY